MTGRLLLACALLMGGCGTVEAPPAVTQRGTPTIDEAALMADLRALAADSMEGRRTGTPGSERARRYLRSALERSGISPLGADWAHPFTFTDREGRSSEGVNLLGVVRGTENADRYIVVTAHYDHLGVQNGEIFNGADDNASGTSAVLALARHFARERPRHSIIFALLDAEEMGLRGATAFVESPPVPLSSIVVNVNLDMVGRNDQGELYAAGTHHYPFLRPHLERVAAEAPVRLLFGHDSPDLPATDDWTLQSDHGAFHRAGIPFVYFGVEDHADYHRPTDTAEGIQPDFFSRAVETVLRSVQELDSNLTAIATAPGR